MLDEAKKIISEYVKIGDRIAIGVSGGMDSMALAHFILSQCGITKDRVLVVNINHKIRGVSSDNDSMFVERFCAENGIEFKGVCVDVPGLAVATGRNIEHTAREARLNVFDSLINSAAVRYVLTAHHAGDNAETVMLNLLRGSGLSGLKGMDILSRKGLLRPLISTPKKQIEEYVRLNKIAYVTDETNLDNSYSRNYLRNELLPQICSRWQGFDERLINLSKEIREASDYLDSEIDSDAIKKTNESSVFIPTECLNKNYVLSCGAVKTALRSIGAERDIERKHIESVVALANKNSGTEINLACGLYAVRQYDGILITYEPPQQANECVQPFKIGRTELGGVSILVSESHAQDKGDLCNHGEGLKCDMNKIPIDAVWRFRREGDIFTPFGGGTKKLKEFLIDRKILRRDRGTIPLLARGSVILAVLDIEISETIKVEPSSKKILTLKSGE